MIATVLLSSQPVGHLIHKRLALNYISWLLK